MNPRYPFGVYTISNRARSASYATSPWNCPYCTGRAAEAEGVPRKSAWLSYTILCKMSSLFSRNLKIIFPAKAAVAKRGDAVQVCPPLFQAVQDVGVPQLRCNLQGRSATTGQELFMKPPAIIQHNFIPSHKQEAGWKPSQVSKQGRDQRVVPAFGVAAGKQVQPLSGHGGVPLPILFI